MSATKALESARDFGVVVDVSGDDLLLAAATEPPARVLDALARYKLEIIGILTPTDTGPTAEDWLASFDERAGIAEFDGGLPRELAELQAIGSCVLDEAMGKTSGRQIEQFIRSLPDHIGRARPAAQKNAAGPGGPEISETTP
jgi:hypothetical protein